MAIGGRICPHCRRYTAKDEPRCLYCNKFLGPQWLTKISQVLGGSGLLATNVIAGLCVLFFMAQVILSVAAVKPTPPPQDFIFFGMPQGVLMALGALSTREHEPWRLLASCFLHMGAVHMLMNMWALYDFARVLEPSMKSPRFFVSYIITGVVGFVVSEIWYSGSSYLTAGASGAVFGVQGLLLGDFLAKKDPRFQQFLWRTVVYSMLFYFALGTNQAAHMGGLAMGIILGFVFGKEARPWYRDMYFKVAAGVCGVAILVMIAFVVKNVVQLL